ncbi:MAG: S8 family serine peptidase, partial [Candidatus Zixiibacteriota bacterium]
RNTDSSGYGLLEIANTYYELTETYYSHPEFGVWIQANSYKLFDYFNSFQPHIKKVIGNFNSAVVWDFAKVLNDSIIVAVIDYGVESHEDLPASRLRPGFDYAQGDNNPTPGQFQGHGMATAGIIAASHTIDSIAGLQASTGVISLNPKVSVLPLKIFNDNGTSTGVFPSEIAQAISFAWKNGAAILSNSWGYGSPCPVPSIYDVLTSAIDSAAAFGRGGKGCPVIFSSGNGGIQTLGVQYPACLPSALSVGALQLSVSIPQVNDYRWSYSQYGSALDLMAPSSSLCLVGTVWTLDRMGTVGYNPGVTQLPNCPSITTWDCPSAGSNDVDYMCQFGGTSGACPIVSGIASLVLSKDPTLTRQQVYNILDSSAVTQLDWGPLPDTPHVEYGYGRVDAFRAILSISRGDLNNDGTIGNVLDLTILVDWIFRGIPPPNFPSPKLGDCNCDGTANNILDLTRLVDWLFRSGPPPVNPCFKF